MKKKKTSRTEKEVVFFSRRHPIFLRGIKLVARRGEFVRDDVAQIHEIVEAFFEGFDGGCVLLKKKEIRLVFRAQKPQ